MRVCDCERERISNRERMAVQGENRRDRIGVLPSSKKKTEGKLGGKVKNKVLFGLSSTFYFIIIVVFTHPKQAFYSF